MDDKPMDVAVTGGDGLVGSVLQEGLDDRFAGRWLTKDDADVTDLEELERAIRGADALVHLAGDPEVEAPWDDLLPANIVGAYHAFEAARRAGVPRVVFASSNHAMGRYMHDDARFADPKDPTTVAADDPVRPDSLYGATKAWGEAVGRLYAEEHGLRVICLRIGWVTPDGEPPSKTDDRREPPEIARRAPGMWLSNRDCVSLVAASLTADVHFAIVNGVSDNVGNWFSLEAGRDVLGWEPKDGIR